jgi:hypothetical protein
MPRDIKELLAEVEKNGFAVGTPIPISGATAELFGNLQPVPALRRLLHYMPVRRFESLVSNKALYLRRLDLFQDQFEGKLPAANDSMTSDFAAQFGRQFGMTEKDVENWKRFITGTHRKHMYVHCWFASEQEDETMWHDYADGGQGLCIHTTAGRLVSALRCPPHLGLDLRRVTYTAETEPLPEIMACLAVGRKQARPEFVREKEVRIIATITEQAWADGFKTADGEPPDHQLIPVNIGALVDAIHLGARISEDAAKRVEGLASEATDRQVTRRSSETK